MSFCIISIINGLIGVVGISVQGQHLTTAALVMGFVSLTFAFILLIIFSCLSCCYSCCRCWTEKAAKKAVKTAKSAAATTVEMTNALIKDKTTSADTCSVEELSGEIKPKIKKEKVKHSYCWNFFSHFAIPIFIFIILYSIFIFRAFKFGDFWFFD